MRQYLYLKSTYVKIILLILVTTATAAQEDSSIVARGANGAVRVVNGELIIGYMLGWANVSTVSDVNNQTIVRSRSSEGYYVGLGVHVPIYSLDARTTLWFVSSAHLGLFRSERERNVNVSGIAEVPVYVSYAYGALPRPGLHWGIEAGIGVNLRYNGYFQSGALQVVPSTLVDISYRTSSSGNVYRLRVTSDIFNTSPNEGVSTRQCSIALIIGIPPSLTLLGL